MTCFHLFRNLLTCSTIAAALVLPVRADMLELTNGDHYRGTIISMSSSNVVFQSEVQGLVTLPREKVASVILRPAVSTQVVSPKPAAPVSGTNASSVAGVPAPPSPQANAVIQQLRQQGVDSKLIEQVQEQIFGKSSPEAARKFDEMMSGLMTGRLSVEDIRKQAQGSIDQIRAAKKELGNDAGDMLDSYLSILEKFVQESAPEPSAAKPAPVTPAR